VINNISTRQWHDDEKDKKFGRPKKYKSEGNVWSPMPPKANPQSQRAAAQRPCSRAQQLKNFKNY